MPSSCVTRRPKSLTYLVDLSYISEGGDEGEGRDEEGLLGLLVRPGPWPFFDPGGGTWVRRWQPLLDTKIGTEDPEKSKSPNKLTAGLDLMFDRAEDWGEHRIRVGVRHNSDRDFDTRELVADLRWLPVPDVWIREAPQRLREFRLRSGNEKKTPRLRSWSLVPFLGVEYGDVLESPEGDDESSFTRWKAGIDLDVELQRFTLSLSDTYRYLDDAEEGEDDTQNILEVMFSYQLTSTQGIGLKFQKGNDVPTFEEVDTLSVSYRFKF